MKTSFTCLAVTLISLLVSSSTVAADNSTRKTTTDGRIEDSGLIIPLDDHGMYIRNSSGQHEVKWTNKTKVALQINFRQVGNIKDNVLSYKIHSSSEVLDFSFPKGPISAEKNIRPNTWKSAAGNAAKESWVSANGLRIYFNETLTGHLPTENSPSFVGSFVFGKPSKLSINGEEIEVSMKKGGQTDILLFGLLDTKDCHPFVNRATVIGHAEGDAIVADEIHLIPIGDSAKSDDPKLPRYLYIGDSISGNYTKGLLASLAGKINAHHPPTNCGPTGKGVSSLAHWLGAYEEPGRHWDVISFNFGHWNAASTKDQYQSDLENICQRLEKTGAKLIWVTTAPVPLGYDPAGQLSEDGKASGRKAGVMQKYLNPWAAEVIARHPKITVHDQWQFVKDNADDLYTPWWQGRNVHFGGQQADALGKHLAQDVMERISQ
ncbi:MAG: hypothetical protein COA78_34270 [Blastopirellula sp.]|nr:MAG: hypothetical protein COA78_34270 [Blastopirellula sp.]